MQNTDKADRERFAADQPACCAAAAQVASSSIDVLTITSTSAAKFDVFRHDVNLACPYYFADATRAQVHYSLQPRPDWCYKTAP
ncbi:MAG: hypothetical protein WKG07_44620 [Hymenobacter sp.]